MEAVRPPMQGVSGLGDAVGRSVTAATCWETGKQSERERRGCVCCWTYLKCVSHLGSMPSWLFSVLPSVRAGFDAKLDESR